MWKRFTFKVVVFTGLVVLFIGAFNWVVDPYSYFHHNKLAKPKNVAKPLTFKLPIIKKGGIDNIMLGTSRIGVLKTEVISKYLSGKTFNLSSPSSLADEQLAILEYALKFNHVKNVIYSIDFMSVNGSRKKRSSEFEELKEKIHNFEDVYSITNFKDLVTLDTTLATITTLRYNFTNFRGTLYLQDGRRDYQGIKEQIVNGKFVLEYNTKNFIANEQYSPFSISEKNFKAIKSIVKLCKDKNIKLIVYTPPMYAPHFFAITTHLNYEFFDFKKKLVEITDYVDLSGINTISKNSQNYYDESHLRENLSEIVFAKIFNDSSIKIPKDFGVLVTKENIESHLTKLKTEREIWRKTHPKDVAEIENLDNNK